MKEFLWHAAGYFIFLALTFCVIGSIKQKCPSCHERADLEWSCPCCGLELCENCARYARRESEDIFEEGQYDGYDVGYAEGYRYGFSVGCEEGQAVGYEEGYLDSHDEWYEEGYIDGYHDAEQDMKNKNLPRE